MILATSATTARCPPVCSFPTRRSRSRSAEACRVRSSAPEQSKGSQSLHVSNNFTALEVKDIARARWQPKAGPISYPRSWSAQNVRTSRFHCGSCISRSLTAGGRYATARSAALPLASRSPRIRRAEADRTLASVARSRACLLGASVRIDFPLQPCTFVREMSGDIFHHGGASG
jgi:hypothetical protein